MSLISDALKRQEQLRAPGTGAAQREVSAARPPEVAVARPPEVAATGSPEVATAKPPEASRGSAAPNLAAPAAQPRAALPPRQPSNRQTVKPSNLFLARERAVARRPNQSVLLMPVIGLLMLLVLLFLRREFVPSQPLQAVTVKKVESEKWEVESSGGPAETQVDVPKDESSVVIDGNRTQSIAVEANQLPTSNSQLPTSNSLSVSASSAPLRENPPPPEPSNGQTVKRSNQTAEASPQQPAWPAFTLTGIAVGRERLAILSTGEMLVAGETSKCGVKVEKVNAATVVFAWGGETKTLRKGEHSDKPAD